MDNNEKNIKNWTYEEGKALIHVYENRKEEWHRTINKDIFWQNCLQDLEALNVLVTPTTAKHVCNKWRTLLRAYRNAKDRGTGSSTSKFIYMEEMDAIYHDNPTYTNNHAVGVGIDKNPVPAPMFKSDISKVEADNNENEQICNKESSTNNSNQNKKKKKETYLDIKKKYYEDKLAQKKEKQTFLENYLMQREQNKSERHRELLEILKNRN